MNALLIYPEYPETFWNFKHALRFIGKKAAYPPLGLLTVAAMLPESWELRLVDMNVTGLRDEHLRWADLVLIGAMSIQQRSVRDVLDRCRTAGVKTVAGGPLFTANPDAFDDVDHLVLNEAEATLPLFLDDFAHGYARHCYTAAPDVDLAVTPLPRWDLVDVRQYAALSLQFSRGCPYDCEFCNITTLYGRKPRVKRSAQIIAELDRLLELGWRGGVFFVDDNLIGNKQAARRELLPAVGAWMERRRYPFTFIAQTSLDLADDDELLRLLSRAGFNTVFVGIESPNEASLQECNKTINTHRDLLASVKHLQRHGLQVQAGFIVGFDHDPESIFERLIHFIQDSGIVTAMVGLLNAPHGTRLYQRLRDEKRLLGEMSGNNTDCSLNFIPRMHAETLLQGYRQVVASIYAPANYYERLKIFLREFQPSGLHVWDVKPAYLLSALKLSVVLGVLEKERGYYWRLLCWSLVNKPRLLPMAMAMAACGFHFRKCFEHCQSAEER